MSIEEEYQYVLSLPTDKQRIYLKDNEFRKRLFSSEGHYPFVWLIQSLEKEQLLYLLDDNIIPLLKNDYQLKDKLNAIITCGNSYNNEFLKKKVVIEMIVKNIDLLHFYLKNLNNVFGDSYFKYLLEIGKVNDIKYLNENVQLKLLENQLYLDIIKHQGINYTFLEGLSKKSI